MGHNALRYCNCVTILLTILFFIVTTPTILKHSAPQPRTFDTIEDVLYSVWLLLIVFTITVIPVIGMLKYWTIRLDREQNTPTLKSCKRDLLIGCVGMLLALIISPFFCPIIIYYTFVSRTVKLCRLVTNLHTVLLVIIIYITIDAILIVAAIFINSHVVYVILFHQIWFTVSQMLVTISLFSVLTGGIQIHVKMKIVCTERGIELKTLQKRGTSEEYQRILTMLEEEIKCTDETSLQNKNQNRLTGMETKTDFEKARECLNEKLHEVLAVVENVPLPTTTTSGPKIVSQEEDSDDGSDVVLENSFEELHVQPTGMICEMCMMKYDERVENQTPRVLIKCGHTMCQGCIEYILGRHGQQFIICPCCQQGTAVDEGNVENLPKNLKILKLLAVEWE